MLKIKTKILFNPSNVKRAVDNGTRRVFSKFGAYVRTSARRSIRKPGKKTKVSLPGKPPRSHTGMLKRLIFFGYDRLRRSVVIGPRKVRGISRGRAPRTLEHGGRMASADTKIKARPYMGPAFGKGKKQLPAMWKNSIKRN